MCLRKEDAMITLTILLLFLVLGVVTFCLTIGFKAIALVFCAGDIIVAILIIYWVIRIIRHFRD